NFTNLQELYLNDEAISDDTVRRVAALTRLRKLQITVPNLKSEEALAALSGLVELHWLEFHGGRISDGALKQLAGLKQLELLSIKVSSGPGAGFRHLSALEKLKYLHVSGGGVTDQAVDQLRGLKNLESIKAQGSTVSVSGAERLAARLPH